MEIKKVVVIGSGTMGSGIAAHLCNANIPVTLLDLKTEISEKARERIYKSKPPLLLDKSKINNINTGNINEDFHVVKNADWIVEAVVERIDIKHNIYQKIFKERKKGAIVSSNTSSIPIKVLSQNLSDEEKKDFCITHFFNPVRYMGLLEIVKNENISNKIFEFGGPDIFSFKELLNTHTKALYIYELIGRGANIITGDYSVGASGMLIENGEFSYPINEITIAGNLSEMFNNITLANDLEFSYVTNSPTLMIEGMVVAGK